jgi:hypothetical protein
MRKAAAVGKARILAKMETGRATAAGVLRGASTKAAARVTRARRLPSNLKNRPRRRRHRPKLILQTVLRHHQRLEAVAPGVGPQAAGVDEGEGGTGAPEAERQGVHEAGFASQLCH